MAETYEPAARRPIADIFRNTAHFAVTLCLRLRISADAISYASIVASGLAALCFWRSLRFPPLLIPACLLCYLRLWFNMLDGMVAIAARTASPRGEILNDLPDRLSDVLVFVGLAHSGWINPFLGYWAAIAAVLTAYVGTFGQAVGTGRQFGGIMSKPWRMVLLSIGCAIAFVLSLAGDPQPHILDIACLLIILGCIQTIIVRLARIMKNLNEKAAG